MRIIEKTTQEQLDVLCMGRCPFCGRDPKLSFRAASPNTEFSKTSGIICFAVCFGGGYSAHAHIYADTPKDLERKWNRRSDLEHGVKMVMNLGLSTGHADTWLQLLDEVLEQYQECASKLREYKHLDSPPGEA